MAAAAAASAGPFGGFQAKCHYFAFMAHSVLVLR